MYVKYYMATWMMIVTLNPNVCHSCVRLSWCMCTLCVQYRITQNVQLPWLYVTFCFSHTHLGTGTGEDEQHGLCRSHRQFRTGGIWIHRWFYYWIVGSDYRCTIWAIQMNCKCMGFTFTWSLCSTQWTLATTCTVLH